MTPEMVNAFVLLTASVIVLTFGYLIAFRKRITLIAGLDVSKVRDSDGLARWVGRGLLGIGVLGVLIGLAGFVAPGPAAQLVIAYVSVNLGGAAVLLVGMRRYLR